MNKKIYIPKFMGRLFPEDEKRSKVLRSGNVQPVKKRLAKVEKIITIVGSRFFPSKENSIKIDKEEIKRQTNNPLVFAFFTIGSDSGPVIRL